MKKTWVVIIALFAVAVIGGYALFVNIFPLATPINCPDSESVTAITLFDKDGSSAEVETADFEEILKKITNARPTRAMSVNDYPTAKAYYTIKIDTESREYRYFLYTEGSRVYIESPYEGIYKTDKQFIDYIADLF